MSLMRQDLRYHFSRKISRVLWHSLRRFEDYPCWYFTAGGLASQKKLKALHNCHKGERCVVIGNGRSLCRTDMGRLANEVTIGLNRIYLAFSQFGFATNYLVAVNPLVLKQFGHEISTQPCEKFISWPARKYVPPSSDVTYIRTRFPKPQFQGDATAELWEGATVTFVALQLAFHMGFHEVILVGVDHYFKTPGRPHQEVRLDHDDENHFAPEYFPAGIAWNLPDLETSERAYRLALAAFELAGRRVLDATVGGHLRVFPRVEFDDVFPNVRHGAVREATHTSG